MWLFACTSNGIIFTGKRQITWSASVKLSWAFQCKAPCDLSSLPLQTHFALTRVFSVIRPVSRGFKLALFPGLECSQTFSMHPYLLCSLRSLTQRLSCSLKAGRSNTSVSALHPLHNSPFLSSISHLHLWNFPEGKDLRAHVPYTANTAGCIADTEQRRDRMMNLAFVIGLGPAMKTCASAGICFHSESPNKLRCARATVYGWMNGFWFWLTIERSHCIWVTMCCSSSLCLVFSSFLQG